MIKQKTNGELIIISGTTCAGKDTVVKELLKRNDNLSLAVSYTSRPIRDGEQEGVDYYFVSPEEFERKIANGDFLEYAKVHYGMYYGTPKDEIKKILANGKDVILVIDVQGAKQIKKMFPETILIFIMAPSMSEIKRRIIARGKESKEQIIDRFNYVVVNDEIENAVKKIEAILISEKCRVDRIEEISVESQEEIIHELLIDKDFDNTPFKIED